MTIVDGHYDMNLDLNPYYAATNKQLSPMYDKSKKTWSQRLKITKSDKSSNNLSSPVSQYNEFQALEYSQSALSRSMKYAEPWIYGTVRGIPARPVHHGQAIFAPLPHEVAVVVCSCPEYLTGTKRDVKKASICKKCKGSRLPLAPIGGTVRIRPTSAPVIHKPRTNAGTMRIISSSKLTRPSILDSQNDPYDLMRRSRLLSPEPKQQTSNEKTTRNRAKSTSPSRGRSRNRVNHMLTTDSHHHQLHNQQQQQIQHHRTSSPTKAIGNGKSSIRSQSASRSNKERWIETIDRSEHCGGSSSGGGRRSILQCNVNPYELISSQNVIHNNNEFAPNTDDMFVVNHRKEDATTTVTKKPPAASPIMTKVPNYINVKAIAGQRISFGEKTSSSALVTQNGDSFMYENINVLNDYGNKSEETTSVSGGCQQSSSRHDTYANLEQHTTDSVMSIQPKRPPRRKQETCSTDDDNESGISSNLTTNTVRTISNKSLSINRPTNTILTPTIEIATKLTKGRTVQGQGQGQMGSLQISSDLVEASQKHSIKSILKRPSSVSSTFSSSSTASSDNDAKYSNLTINSSITNSKTGNNTNCINNSGSGNNVSASGSGNHCGSISNCGGIPQLGLGDSRSDKNRSQNNNNKRNPITKTNDKLPTVSCNSDGNIISSSKSSIKIAGQKTDDMMMMKTTSSQFYIPLPQARKKVQFMVENKIIHDDDEDDEGNDSGSPRIIVNADNDEDEDEDDDGGYYDRNVYGGSSNCNGGNSQNDCSGSSDNINNKFNNQNTSHKLNHNYNQLNQHHQNENQYQNQYQNQKQNLKLKLKLNLNDMDANRNDNNDDNDNGIARDDVNHDATTTTAAAHDDNDDVDDGNKKNGILEEVHQNSLLTASTINNSRRCGIYNVDDNADLTTNIKTATSTATTGAVAAAAAAATRSDDDWCNNNRFIYNRFSREQLQRKQEAVLKELQQESRIITASKNDRNELNNYNGIIKMGSLQMLDNDADYEDISFNSNSNININNNNNNNVDEQQQQPHHHHHQFSNYGNGGVDTEISDILPIRKPQPIRRAHSERQCNIGKNNNSNRTPNTILNFNDTMALRMKSSRTDSRDLFKSNNQQQKQQHQRLNQPNSQGQQLAFRPREPPPPPPSLSPLSSMPLPLPLQLPSPLSSSPSKMLSSKAAPVAPIKGNQQLEGKIIQTEVTNNIGVANETETKTEIDVEVEVKVKSGVGIATGKGIEIGGENHNTNDKIFVNGLRDNLKHKEKKNQIISSNEKPLRHATNATANNGITKSTTANANNTNKIFSNTTSNSRHLSPGNKAMPNKKYEDNTVIMIKNDSTTRDKTEIDRRERTTNAANIYENLDSSKKNFNNNVGNTNSNSYKINQNIQSEMPPNIPNNGKANILPEAKEKDKRTTLNNYEIQPQTNNGRFLNNNNGNKSCNGIGGGCNSSNNHNGISPQRTVVRVAPFNKSTSTEIHRLKITHTDDVDKQFSDIELNTHSNSSDNNIGQKRTSIMINGDDCYSTVNVSNDTPIYQSSVVVTDGSKTNQNQSIVNNQNQSLNQNTVTINVSSPHQINDDIIYKNNKINTLLLLNQNASKSIIPIGDAFKLNLQEDFLNGNESTLNSNANITATSIGTPTTTTLTSASMTTTAASGKVPKRGRTLIKLDYEKSNNFETDSVETITSLSSTSNPLNNSNDNNANSNCAILNSTKTNLNDEVFSHEAELVKILRNPVEAVRRNLVPHICGKSNDKEINRTNSESSSSAILPTTTTSANLNKTLISNSIATAISNLNLNAVASTTKPIVKSIAAGATTKAATLSSTSISRASATVCKKVHSSSGDNDGNGNTDGKSESIEVETNVAVVTPMSKLEKSSFIGKLLEDPTLNHLAEGLDDDVVVKLVENSLRRLKDNRNNLEIAATKDNDNINKLINTSLMKIKEERLKLTNEPITLSLSTMPAISPMSPGFLPTNLNMKTIDEQERQSNRESLSSNTSFTSANYEMFDFEHNESDCYQSCSSELTTGDDDANLTRNKFYQLLVDATLAEIEISTNNDDEHHYESIRLNGGDPIYEEISEIPPPLPLSPPPIINDNELDKKSSSRSIFEGASKYDILSYLVDAKERGIVREESFEYNSNNLNPIIMEEEANDTVSDLKPKQIIVETIDNMTRNQNLNLNLNHLLPIVGGGIGGLLNVHGQNQNQIQSQNQMHLLQQRKSSTVDIERNDSGVGSETSKSSRSKYQNQAGCVISKNSAIHLCEDCDGAVETQITDSGVMFAPLVCRKCGKKRAERKEIITEICETEEKYGRDLQIILEEFCQPMLVAGLLNQEQLSAIFLNAEELLENNQTLAERMRDALDIALEQGDDDLLTVNIGKIFLESTPMLHAFESYCVRQAAASLLLANLEKEKELLRIFLKVSQMENTVLRRMNLNSFLMVPVQRVTKYPLLLARLYKVTPLHLDGRDLLKQAQEKIELHLNHINQEAKDVPTKLWRRISSSSPNRRASCEIDMINIKLRKMAIDILEWNHDEVRFAMEGKLLFTLPNDSNWKKGRTIKLTPVNALLVTNGKPTASYKGEKLMVDQLNFPKHTGIREASLLLVKEKCGRYTLIREPLYLDKCVICTEADWDDYFEVHEISSKDTFIFKAEDGVRTKQWYTQLQYHAQGMGAWRKRRNALANIMINGMLSRT